MRFGLRHWKKDDSRKDAKHAMSEVEGYAK